ncbi:hypothetical protein [Streptomyces sp. NPDC101132]
MSALGITLLALGGWIALSLVLGALLARAGHHRNKHRRNRR